MWIALNARLRPMDRSRWYADPLDEVLVAHAPGCRVGGGGTQLGTDREPIWCDIDLDVEGDPASVLTLVIATLEGIGAPKGSKVRLTGGEEVLFGATEGLAVYLNGTDLSDEVYANSDGHAVIAALNVALGPHGQVQSYWDGPRETALCLYRPSATRMMDLVPEVLARASRKQSVVESSHSTSILPPPVDRSSPLSDST
jgi:hypothetical protein